MIILAPVQRLKIKSPVSSRGILILHIARQPRPGKATPNDSLSKLSDNNSRRSKRESFLDSKTKFALTERLTHDCKPVNYLLNIGQNPLDFESFG